MSVESVAALARGGRSAHLAERHPMIAAEPGSRALSASALRPLAATFLTVAGTPGQPLR